MLQQHGVSGPVPLPSPLTIIVIIIHLNYAIIIAAAAICLLKSPDKHFGALARRGVNAPARLRSARG